MSRLLSIPGMCLLLALLAFPTLSQAQDGCTDPAACNFDAGAVTDDGSCLTDYGCTYTLACNYDPSATCDDGNCEYPDGCTDPAACNYEDTAICDDGSCSYITPVAHDECTGAIPLTLGLAVTADNSNSCVNGNAIFCSTYSPIQDIWYSVTSVDGSPITVSTTLNGTISSTQINVFESFYFECYGSSITCNQDTEASVTFDPDCGETYYIQIGGQNNAIGTFDVLASASGVAPVGCTDPLACNFDSDPCAVEDGSCTYPAVTNDNCSSPIALVSSIGEAGDLAESCSTGEGSYCFGDGASDLWYSYTATFGGEVSIDIISDVTTYVYAEFYTSCGSRFDGTSCIYSWNGSLGNQVLALGCGETVLIQVLRDEVFGATPFTITATDDDGMGCTDSSACNYIDNACGIDDGSCIYPDGCTSSYACNYDPMATCDDDSCIYPSGCADPIACNYDAESTCDDGSCLYVTAAANDTCEDAVDLSVGATFTVFNGTSCFDSPVYTECSNGFVRDVWYSITSATGGDITLTPTDIGGMNSPTFAVYATCDFNSTIACSNGYAPFTFNPACGETYFLLVGGNNGETGSLVISYSEAASAGGGCTDPTACNYEADACLVEDGSCIMPTLSNETCDGAIALVEGVTLAQDMTDACISDPNTWCAGNEQIDLWYSITSLKGGEITITNNLLNSVSGFTTVFDACGGNAVSCYSGYSEAFDAVFQAECGVVYYVQVHGYNQQIGTFEMSYTESTVMGCTNPLACNYHACSIEDGSCILPDGCTDYTACNYDPTATCDDGSCVLSPGQGVDFHCVFDHNEDCTIDSDLCENGFTQHVSGWSDSVVLSENITAIDVAILSASCEGSDFNINLNGASLYYEDYLSCDCNDEVLYSFNAGDLAAQLAGSNTLEIVWDGEVFISAVLVTVTYATPVSTGCTDPMATNYDSEAYCGSLIPCVYTGCTDVTACNYSANALSDDGSCMLPDGCTDPTNCNYDPAALCDDGSCGTDGCTYPLACNYDPTACTEDGSCDFAACLGCTYTDATNYNAGASVDDGTCLFAPAVGCDGTDVNDDGFVGSSDLLEILGAFGSTCP